MNWKVAIGAGLAIGLGAGGYFLWKYVKKQSVLIEDYEVELLGIKFSSFNQDLITVGITVRLFNKSDVEVTVQSVYMDVKLNNAPVGNISNNGSFVVAAKGYSDVKLNLSFASKEVLKNIVGALFASVKMGDIPYQLKGYVKVKSGFVGFSVPFEYSGTLKGDIMG